MAKQDVKNYLRLDKIPRTGHSESAVHEDKPLLAGHWVTLGDVINPRNREEVAATIATAAGEFDALIAPVYLDKGFTNFDILYESIPAGEPTRALILQKGDIVSFIADAAPGVEAGMEVEVGEDGFGVKEATGSNIVGRCIQVDYEPNVGTLAVIRIA